MGFTTQISMSLSLRLELWQTFLLTPKIKTLNQGIEITQWTQKQARNTPKWWIINIIWHQIMHFVVRWLLQAQASAQRFPDLCSGE